MTRDRVGNGRRGIVAMRKKGDIQGAISAATPLPRLPHSYDNSQLLLHREALGTLEGISPSQYRFLLAYSVSGNITQACSATSTARRMHYEWLKKPEYEAAFNEATKLADEYLEHVAFSLATGRIMRPVVSAGKLVTEEAIYDTRLLHRLLAARRPDKYGTKVDVTSKGQSIVKLVDKAAWDAV